LSDFPPIAFVIPHQEPMVLLDRIVDWEPGQIVCALRVREGARFVEDGLLSVPLTIEHMAQAVAACLGYEAYRGGEGVRIGMIVACRTFKAFKPSASVGDELLIRAERERGNETLSHFNCEIERGEETVATATLTLFHGENLVEHPA